MKLNGKWKLYPIEDSGSAVVPEDLKDIKSIEANVPGNVELDLIENGILPENIFYGMNIKLAEKYETYDWWYKTEFDTPEHTRNMIIRFDGVDCFAEYWLNGKRFAQSDNALVEHEFDITEYLMPQGEENQLFVKIKSPFMEANEMSYDLYNVQGHWNPDVDGIATRKAAHSYGWDIMPRAVSAGIWRDVTVYEKDIISISQVNYCVDSLDENEAEIRFMWELDIPGEMLKKDNYVVISAKCGNSDIEVREKVYFKLGKAVVKVHNPKVWWPYGYGEANVYDAVISVESDGRVVSKKRFNLGIKTVHLERTDITDGINGRFEFIINGVRIICKGANWVQLDAYHSRDITRYDKALDLLKDVGANIVRCWGGNVYEQDCFYDFCDKNGIMVWQDFAMACGAYPQNEAFYRKIEEEAVKVVRRIRTHPCLILWSGDNECDQLLRAFGADPSKNKITREILPRVVQNNDTSKPYLASSPYISKRAVKDFKSLPETHLWGPRDYFKSDYYRLSKAHFISEIGYYGCASPNSLKKFIAPEYLCDYRNNEQWNLHSSDQRNQDVRIRVLADEIKVFFGYIPSELDDFSKASQFVQAEGMKYFIERVRCDRTKSGIIWWNLLDGWPENTEAVVDYYFEKKIAYDYIKRAEAPFVMMIDEVTEWNNMLIAVNDTLEKKYTEYKVWDIDTKECFASGKFLIEANSILKIKNIKMLYSEKRFLVIEWKMDGKTYYNHYLSGMPSFDFERYKEQFEKFNEYIKNI